MGGKGSVPHPSGSFSQAEASTGPLVPPESERPGLGSAFLRPWAGNGLEMALPSRLVVKPADICKVRPVPCTSEVFWECWLFSADFLLSLVSLRCCGHVEGSVQGPWAVGPHLRPGPCPGPLLMAVCSSGSPRQVQGTTSLCRKCQGFKNPSGQVDDHHLSRH